MTITVFDSYKNKKEFDAREGETVFQLFVRNHIELDSPCQGNRSCHKCRITVDGKPSLACACQVYDGMVVEIWPMQGVRFRS